MTWISPPTNAAMDVATTGRGADGSRAFRRHPHSIRVGGKSNVDGLTALVPPVIDGLSCRLTALVPLAARQLLLPRALLIECTRPAFSKSYQTGRHENALVPLAAAWVTSLHSSRG